MATRNSASSNALGEPASEAVVVVLARIVVAHRSQIYQARKIPTNLRQRPIRQIPASRLDILVFEFPVHTRAIELPFSSAVPVCCPLSLRPLGARPGGHLL
jgi:hypothetical protein